jgi:teichuronic acid exporter
LNTMDLKTRTIKATAWYASTRLWMQGLSWAVTLVLARLLTPNDYGLFAMALAVISFFELFQDFGYGVAIVQRDDLTDRHLSTIFWIVSVASLVVTAFAFIGAGFAARFYSEPRLAWMVRLLSLTFLLNSLGMVPYSLLTKEIDFRQRSLAEAYGVVSSAAVTLGLAYMGYGVGALLSGHLVRTAVRNGAMIRACRWFPGLVFSWAGMRDITTFGLNVAGASGITSISEVVSVSIIGRFLGGYDLGLYSMADSLGRSNPLHRLSTAVLNQLSLPVFAKLQRNDEQLRMYFLKITKYLAVISLPMQIGLALVATDAVYVLLSQKWLPMVGILQIFSLGGICYILPLPTGPLLQARGRADLGLRLSVLSAVALTIAFLIGAKFGLSGVALGWLVAFCAVRVYMLSFGMREIGLTLRTYLENLLAPLAATAAMAAAILALRMALASPASALERLALDVGIGAVVYGLVLIVIDRGFGTEVRHIVHEMFAGSRG